MISGMYLGDIVRRVILRMSQESDVFGPVSAKLSTRFALRYFLFSKNLFMCVRISMQKIVKIIIKLDIWKMHQSLIS